MRICGSRGGTGDRPAVVWVHGLEGRRSETQEWDLELAQAGAVVIDVDYRIFPVARWREQTADIACALGWVGANAARLGVGFDLMWGSPNTQNARAVLSDFLRLE